MIRKAIPERKGRKECAKGAKLLSIDPLRPLRILASFAFGIWFFTTAHAQDDASVAAERARLKAGREQAEAQFRAQEQACYRKFAVNDCLSAARAKRRTAVDDLRRQEIALNDAERKRKAAERRQAIDDKAQAQRQRDEAAQAKPPADAGRETRADDRAGRASQPASSAKAAERVRDVRQRQAEMAASRQQRAEQAASNAREHDERVRQAQERADKVKQRLAQEKKPPASALKDPE